jgi:hypothetical protein
VRAAFLQFTVALPTITLADYSQYSWHEHPDRPPLPTRSACAANATCIGYTYHSGDLHPNKTSIFKFYLKTSGSSRITSPDWSRHVKAAAGCYLGRRSGTCANATAGWSSRAKPPRPQGPCDVLASAGTPCVAAHSLTRAMYANYTGPLYRVLRDSDKAGLDIGADLITGVAKSAQQDAFCASTSCFVLRLYDQSPYGNHLDTAPAGGACRHPLSPVNATREPIAVGGQSVYGAYFEGALRRTAHALQAA